MATEMTFRWAFLVLLVALLAMRFYFMVKVRRAGERLMSESAIRFTQGFWVGVYRLRY